MNFNDTVKGSALEGFYPAGWDFEKIDKCIGAARAREAARKAANTYGENSVAMKYIGIYNRMTGKNE